MERTTDLVKLRKHDPFVWGEVTGIYEVGEYNIVQYHPWKVKDSTVLVGDANLESLQYACYINGKSIGQSALSLDEALAVCIAYKRDGINSRAALYFMRMLRQE